MATNNVSFADWRKTTNENLMSTAENLLEKLEDVADMLSEIDETILKSEGSDEMNGARPEVIRRFHEGVQNARNVVGVLKREKWRLSRREMSVELRMGELEDYKSHLQSDMSNLNQTVDALSLRVIQLEHQLVEAQEVQETLEAELADSKQHAQELEKRNASYQKKQAETTKELHLLRGQTNQTILTENQMLKNEIAVLLDENQKLKELIRGSEDTTAPLSNDEHLSRLTRDFLRQLSSLDDDRDEQDHGDMSDKASIGSRSSIGLQSERTSTSSVPPSPIELNGDDSNGHF